MREIFDIRARILRGRTSNRRHIRRLIRRRGLLKKPSNLLLHRALGRNLAVLLEKQIRQSPGSRVILLLPWLYGSAFVGFWQGALERCRGTEAARHEVHELSRIELERGG